MIMAHGRQRRRFGAAAIVVALICALFSSIVIEAAHAGQVAVVEAAHVEPVLTAHQDGGSERPHLIQGGHCVSHCAGQAVAAPPTADSVVIVPTTGSGWTPLPEDRHTGIPPTLKDQPPRG